jgi:predicted pyridoxine 5'-phosphate oxidase superfamily flavin-nucleotide-binding protein
MADRKAIEGESEELHSFQHYAFGDSARKIQQEAGSRKGYQRMDEMLPFTGLDVNEKYYLSLRDSFYLASVGRNGWPYVQHRGGPPGFLKVLDDHHLAFPDYSGNKQFISVANVTDGSPVSLILVNYETRERLKIWARATVQPAKDVPELADQLTDPNYAAKIERVFLLEVVAFDWNCPKHITSRKS